MAKKCIELLEFRGRPDDALEKPGQQLELVLARELLYFATLRHGFSMDLEGPKHAAVQSLPPSK